MVADRTAKPQTPAHWMPRALLLACVLVLAAAMSVSARAESDQSLAWCKGDGDPTLERQIGACTALIEAKSGEPLTRALNYFRRAGAYLRQQDFDKAISDFGDGLALDAGNAAAHYGRAIAYEAKKDTDRAIADYDAAIRLDPRNVRSLSNRAAIYADMRAY
jgi:tetratricopeptide (TPR) repeat protein